MNAAGAERDQLRGMTMQDAADVRTRAIDLAVDEALRVCLQRPPDKNYARRA